MFLNAIRSKILFSISLHALYLTMSRESQDSEIVLEINMFVWSHLWQKMALSGRLATGKEKVQKAMCFNKEFTLAFTALSTGLGAWVLNGKGIWDVERWRRLRIASMFFWFALMEFLQFIQYLVINDCSNPVNIFWTTFGWIHIAFQPFFSNLAMSALNKGNLRKERDETWQFIFRYCFVGGALMSLRILIPLFFWPDPASHGVLQQCSGEVEELCGPRTCSTTGVFHIQWTFKMLKAGYAFPGIAFHFLAMFIAPILMGQTVGTIVLFLTGPGLALLFAGVKDGERAAIWCFFSIAEAAATTATQYIGIRLAKKGTEEAVAEKGS
jgi:hypothetical protein